MNDETRGLAAMMFTDMIGYRDVVGQDESLAKLLLDKQRSIIRQTSSAHGGRDAGGNLAGGEGVGLRGWLTGVGVKTHPKLHSSESLLLFERALDATRCAVEIQRALREYNRQAPSSKDIYVRIGIHIGDVANRGGEVSGEAVAVASRVAPLAEPGGICISKQVYDQIRNKVEFPIVALGSQQLKNVQVPLEVYRIALPWEGEIVSTGPSLDRRRVVVLPLVNMISDSADEYFADGMTEELISTISNIGELSVISRTSAMKFKGGGKTVGEIGRELKAGTLLEGSVRKSENRIRITVQLIDANDDRHVWSQSYDRNLEDVFSIQSEIAQSIAGMLKVKLLAGEKAAIERKPTENLEAHSMYLKGRYYWNKRSEEGLKKAIEYFQKAIEDDRNYALAYSGVADCYLILANGYMPPAEASSKAKEYAIKALQLNDALAEAHTSLAMALEALDWDWKGSEREFRTALELNPSYATAHHWYALLLELLGRFDEAISEIHRAQELDPLSLIINAAVARVYDAAGQYDKAIEQSQRLLEMEPGFAIAHIILARSYGSKKLCDESLREYKVALNLDPNDLTFRMCVGYAYGMAGNLEEARKTLNELLALSKSRYVSPGLLYSLYFVLGEEENMFLCLEKVFEERDVNLAYLRFDTDFVKYRHDPRFIALIRKMGLEVPPG